MKRWAQEELQLPEEVAKSFGNSLREEDVTGEGLASFIVKHKLHLLLLLYYVKNTGKTLIRLRAQARGKAILYA